MDTVARYHEAITRVLHEFVEALQGMASGLETLLISDEPQQTYAILELGWEGKQRVCLMLVLVRIVETKVWMEVDNTDYGFVDRLIAAGIPMGDLVLAFHHPALRQHTPFAVV